MYYLWSMRNRAWFRPRAQGYAVSAYQAGKYPEMEAVSFVFASMPCSIVAVPCELGERHLAAKTPDEIEATLAKWSRL